jgi:hypothetical protein
MVALCLDGEKRIFYIGAVLIIEKADGTPRGVWTPPPVVSLKLGQRDSADSFFGEWDPVVTGIPVMHGLPLKSFLCGHEVALPKFTRLGAVVIRLIKRRFADVDSV